MKDPTSQLRSATRRAKSDVANKLVSMFLHELSRRLSRTWQVAIDGPEYENLVREQFRNRCPYCSCELTNTVTVIEHLDGMNRYRVGLHVPGTCWWRVDGATTRSGVMIHCDPYTWQSRAGNLFYLIMAADVLPNVLPVCTGRESGRMRRNDTVA